MDKILTLTTIKTNKKQMNNIVPRGQSLFTLIKLLELANI